MPKISGHLLVAVGVVHNLVGVVFGFGYLAEIAHAGFFNAVEPHFPRQTVFWFLFTGLLFILIGQVCLWAERRLDRPLPAFVGWELLAFSVVGVVLIPVSGFWLVIALALYMIAAARRAPTLMRSA